MSYFYLIYSVLSFFLLPTNLINFYTYEEGIFCFFCLFFVIYSFFFLYTWSFFFCFLLLCSLSSCENATSFSCLPHNRYFTVIHRILRSSSLLSLSSVPPFSVPIPFCIFFLSLVSIPPLTFPSFHTFVFSSSLSLSLYISVHIISLLSFLLSPPLLFIYFLTSSISPLYLSLL